MLKTTKRVQTIKEKVDVSKLYPAEEALQLLKDCSQVKFDESVDIAVNLGIDVRKSDQQVRGATILPKGTGRKVRVAVFAGGDDAVAAKEAGADMVGLEDLAEQIKQISLDNIVVIATPDAMPVASKLGRILGPRRLIPSPKVGTVTKDVKKAVADAKAGRVQYQSDKNGIIHCAVGKLSFSSAALLENIYALLSDLRKAKPSVAKGVYLKKISLSTTMGPGVTVDQNSIDG